MRVLVVEDEHRVAAYIGQALAEESFAVDLARDGPGALLLTAEHQYDAIVLDLMLPGLDGLTVCRRVRETRASTPILILSARDMVEDRIRGLDAGADDYLVKPFAIQELLARVRALIRRDKIHRGRVIHIEDLEIDEQLEPMIGGLVAGSAAGAIPGASVIASYIVSSVLTGAANALFTLRVGVLTKKYCASLTHQDRRTMRRAATVEAVGMLGGIVLESGTSISKRVFAAAKRQIGKKVWSPLSNQVGVALKRAKLRKPDDE